MSQVSIYLAPRKTLQSLATSPTRLDKATGLTGFRRTLLPARPSPSATMTESVSQNDDAPAAGEPAQPPPPPKRSPGHRGQDVRDTVAELAARAHEISLEAGSKMSGALRDVIGAAAGMTAFAVESARDLVNYMVRRGQMTQDEADKLIREAEEASSRRSKAPKVDAVHKPSGDAKPKAAPKAKASAAPAKKAAPKKTPPKKPAAKK